MSSRMILGPPLQSDFFDESSERPPSQHTSDEVNHPKHYTSHPAGIEAIQITEHFCNNLGNVIKYIWRAEEKGAPIKDLKKALWYLTREIGRREKNAKDKE